MLGKEGGWVKRVVRSPAVVGAVGGYDSRERWFISVHGGKFKFKNPKTGRLLFSDGKPVTQ